MDFTKRDPPVGSRPGTLAIGEDAEPTRVAVHRYAADEWEKREIEGISDLTAFPKLSGSFWIDIQGVRDESRLRELGDCLGLHPLVLEDAVNVPQRPKSEPYPEHHLLVARVPILESSGSLRIPQVSILFGRNRVLTFQERYLGVFDPVRRRMEAGRRRPIRSLGSDYMPELRSPRAYPAVLATMLAMSIGMVTYFRHRGWVRSSRRAARGADRAQGGSPPIAG